MEASLQLDESTAPQRRVRLFSTAGHRWLATLIVFAYLGSFVCICLPGVHSRTARQSVIAPQDDDPIQVRHGWPWTFLDRSDPPEVWMPPSDWIGCHPC